MKFASIYCRAVFSALFLLSGGLSRYCCLLFHNILTQHLVHKNSIRLIAYYLFITQIHEKLFDENLVLTLKATFLKFIHLFSLVNDNLTSTFDEKVRLGHFQIQPIKLFDMHQMCLFEVKFPSTGTIGVFY